MLAASTIVGVSTGDDYLELTIALSLMVGAIYLLMATRRVLFGPVVHEENAELSDLARAHAQASSGALLSGSSCELLETCEAECKSAAVRAWRRHRQTRSTCWAGK